MRILALDAAGLTCSAALLDGGQCLAEQCGGNSRTATAALPGIVAALLNGTGFDAVGVTVGPGSFTGLRGALALAHGLALGAGVTIVGVTVAEALVHGVAHPGPLWVALDARRTGRIFLDDGTGMRPCLLSAVASPPSPVLVLGDAAEAVCAAVSGTILGERRSVSAADVGRVALRRIAGEVSLCPPQPLYIEAPAIRERAPA